jgi:hypothetical protein
MKETLDFHSRFSSKVKEEMAQMKKSVMQERKKLFKEKIEA